MRWKESRLTDAGGIWKEQGSFARFHSSRLLFPFRNLESW